MNAKRCAGMLMKLSLFCAPSVASIATGGPRWSGRLSPDAVADHNALRPRRRRSVPGGSATQLCCKPAQENRWLCSNATISLLAPAPLVWRSSTHCSTRRTRRRRSSSTIITSRGGHWNDAYPFVRLHQPSHFYGVPSTELGSKRIDRYGFNEGLYELASSAELQAYFDRVMRERFLPSGRVQYFPMTEFIGGSTFKKVLSAEEQQVTVRRRVVDSTFFKTTVPSSHERAYDVGDGVACIAPNELPRRAESFRHFCIVGAGKTAMDTGVWLLESGVEPGCIHWVCPRRSWMLNRRVTQASLDFFQESIGGFADQLEALAEATSIEDAFDRMEACGFMLRIDRDRRPEMFHYATISPAEVERLRRIENLIESGRVRAIQPGSLLMQSGESIAMPEDTLYIDCTASAVDFKSTVEKPVFEDNLITIQPIRMPNPCLSASIIAFVEANFDDDFRRNQLCKGIALPDDEAGFVRATLGNMVNQVSGPRSRRWSSSSTAIGWTGLAPSLVTWTRATPPTCRSSRRCRRSLSQRCRTCMPSWSNAPKRGCWPGVRWIHTNPPSLPGTCHRPWITRRPAGRVGWHRWRAGRRLAPR